MSVFRKRAPFHRRVTEGVRSGGERGEFLAPEEDAVDIKTSVHPSPLNTSPPAGLILRQVPMMSSHIIRPGCRAPALFSRLLARGALSFASSRTRPSSVLEGNSPRARRSGGGPERRTGRKAPCHPSGGAIPSAPQRGHSLSKYKAWVQFPPRPRPRRLR